MQNLPDPQAAHSPSGDQRRRHGSQSQHNPLCKYRAVALFDQPHPYRNGKDNRTAKHRGRHDSRVPSDQRILRQLHGKLISAHIDGQKASKHGGVHPKEPVNRNDKPSQRPRYQRGQADDPHHGQRGRPQILKAFLKFLPIPKTVPQDTVNSPSHGAQRHNDHNNPVYHISVSKIKFNLSPDTVGCVSLYHKHDTRGRPHSLLSRYESSILYL